MIEHFHWSESAGRYEPLAPVNRRFLGDMAFLISLGVPEEQVTGEVADCGVSYLGRLALLQPRARARGDADAGSRSPAASPHAERRTRPRLRSNVGQSA